MSCVSVQLCKTHIKAPRKHIQLYHIKSHIASTIALLSMDNL